MLLCGTQYSSTAQPSVIFIVNALCIAAQSHQEAVPIADVSLLLLAGAGRDAAVLDERRRQCESSRDRRPSSEAGAARSMRQLPKVTILYNTYNVCSL
jgi:hypothetical protein